MYMFFRQRPNKYDSAVLPLHEIYEGMYLLHLVRLQAYEPAPHHFSYPVYL